MTRKLETSAWLLMFVGACASSSTAADVRTVRELSQVSALADVADTEVEPATAQDVRRLLTEPLSGDTALRIALLNNRELRAQLRELGIARGQLMQAGLLPNPGVEVELSPERNTQIELRVEYDLTRALLTPMRSAVASSVLHAQRHRVAAAVVSLGASVRQALVAFEAAQARVELAHEMQQGFDARAAAAKLMFDAGNLPEIDLVNEQAMAERARITVAKLELEAMTDRETLQRLLGLYGTEASWTLAADASALPAEPPPMDDLEGRAMRASLELKAMRAMLDALARRVGLVSAEGWIPDVSVDAHALHGNPEDGASEPEPSLRWGGGLSVGVPLFDRRQGDVVAIEAERDALLERYYGAAIDIRSAARQVRARIRSAHQRALRYQGVILPGQARLTQQTLLQYNAMQVGLFQVLQARREELDAQLAAIDTLREYRAALTALQALLAGARADQLASESFTMPASAGAAGGH